MSIIGNTLRSLFTPRLYAIYSSGLPDPYYKPYELEKWGDKFLSSIVILWKISVYTSPLVGIYLYRSSLLTIEGFPTLVRFAGVVGITIVASYLCRGIGRAMNPQYQAFVDILQAPNAFGVCQRKFDYDFAAFPVTYYAHKKSTGVQPKFDSGVSKHSFMSVMSAVAVRMFGLRLIYPGSIGLIHNALWPELLRGRRNLMESENGQRHKVRTADGNDIDCMFVDNRNTSNSNGKTLVVCCEGNSGFYEIGIMTTPLSDNYSVLGWNHPGFGGSTGLPYPEQEQNAVEAIMEFATDKLGFTPSDIVVFGWSIGGYSAAYAASKYPDIKCLFLDATFDDLLPLALARMPPSWAPLVRCVVSQHVNLNVGELAVEYPGDFRIVRRVHDEIIAIREGDISTNCGNALLVRLFKHRHPELMSGAPARLLDDLLRLEGVARERALASTEHDAGVKTMLRLVKKHLRDYDSTHCTALPVSEFDIPKTQ